MDFQSCEHSIFSSSSSSSLIFHSNRHSPCQFHIKSRHSCGTFERNYKKNCKDKDDRAQLSYVQMERKDEAAVERQKLVDDGEVENDEEHTNIASNVPPNAPKAVQSPSSPVLSNRVRVTTEFLVHNVCTQSVWGSPDK